MANFGIRLTFLIDADTREEAAQKVMELMEAGVNGSDVHVDAAMIAVDALPTEMGGTGNSPDSKPQLTKAERERREMIRRSCDRRMN